MNKYCEGTKRTIEPTKSLLSPRWLFIGILLVTSQLASAVTCSVNSSGVDSEITTYSVRKI